MKIRYNIGVMKALGIILCLFFVLFNYSPAMVALRGLPDVIYAANSDTATDKLDTLPAPLSYDYDEAISVSQSNDQRLNIGEESTVTIDLFGIIPIKTVTIRSGARKILVPGGESVGVALHTRGVLVVGTSNITIKSDSGTETLMSPAVKSGIKAGDVIYSANGTDINDTDHLIEVIAAANGHVALYVKRDNQFSTIAVEAIEDPLDGSYKLGMWVRDSTAGIGTVCFYDPVTLKYAALGHAITDVDTNTTFDVANGEIARCVIVGATKGEVGRAGELMGSFGSDSDRLGSIEENGDFGLYGTLYSADMLPPVDKYSKGLPVAHSNEVRTGEATVISAVKSDDNGRNIVSEYTCKVVKLFTQTSAATKGFVIEITDSRLTDVTGGIVQGMSGSPIIQNGRIIGVITHVMINDPLRGYCMYAEWMADKMD